MPAVKSNTNARVLVTGANGFLAMWIVRVLLEQGFTVRGTVRTDTKGRELERFFASFKKKFEWIVVKDITAEGAFDEAVKDVDAVAHTASPVDMSQDDPEAYIRPAVDGTLSVLNSAVKFGENIKRIVITSSLGALLPVLTGPIVLDESNWGDEVVELVEKQGKAAPAMTKYWASKTLAEKAAWVFYEKFKANSGWELVVLNPSIVIGPPLQEFRTPKEAPTSVQYWYDHIFNEKDDEELKGTLIYVDVRDVAEAHLRSITKESAAGERILVSAGSCTHQESRNTVFALKPEYYSSGILPRGNPDIKGDPAIILKSTKAQDILKVKYRTFEESTIATLATYEEKGLVKK